MTTTWPSATAKVDGACAVEQPGGAVSSHAYEPAPRGPLKVDVAVTQYRVRHTDNGLVDNDFGGSSNLSGQLGGVWVAGRWLRVQRNRIRRAEPNCVVTRVTPIVRGEAGAGDEYDRRRTGTAALEVHRAAPADVDRPGTVTVTGKQSCPGTPPQQS